MASEFELNAEPRADLGKGASRRLRLNGDMVPAIIYGGADAPESISIPHKDLMKATENEAFFSHILTINVGGKKESAIIKDLQRHPAKPRIMHADFQRTVRAIVERHTGPLDDAAFQSALSRNGRFVSVTVTVVAKSQDQLDAIYRDATAHADVLMAL